VIDEQERMALTENNRSQSPEEAIVAGRFFQAVLAYLGIAQEDTDPAHRRSGEERSVD